MKCPKFADKRKMILQTESEETPKLFGNVIRPRSLCNQSGTTNALNFYYLNFFQGPGEAGVPVSGVRMRRPQALPRVRHHQVQRSQGHRAGG